MLVDPLDGRRWRNGIVQASLHHIHGIVSHLLCAKLFSQDVEVQECAHAIGRLQTLFRVLVQPTNKAIEYLRVVLLEVDFVRRSCFEITSENVPEILRSSDE